MSLTELKSGLLYVVVFGPGFGESIVLRSPEDKWLIVDSCEKDGRVPAVELLDHHNATWDCAVLTHPHVDHGMGFDEIINKPGSGPIGCSHPEIVAPEIWYRTDDDRERLISGKLEATISAIQQRWGNNDRERWAMRRGDSREIGDVRLTVLHPDDAALESHVSDFNRISSPILVEWRDSRILLGADLISVDWDALPDEFEFLHDHHLLKMPHHGSSGSTSERYGHDSRRGSCWIYTHSTRGHKLPRFEQGHGVEWALERVNAVHLTSLPDGRRDDVEEHLTVSREQLLEDKGIAEPALPSVGGVEIESVDRDEPTEEFRYYVAAGFESTGELAELIHGTGSITIT